MRFYVGTSSSSRDQPPVPGAEVISPSGALPANHPPVAASAANGLPAQCPMSSSSQEPRPQQIASGSRSKSGAAQCPIQHDKPSTSTSTEFNPLNMIPANLSLHKQPNQKLDLPTERTESSIPRPSADTPNPGGEAYGTGTNWDYPSPQQFYNALVRKGWETPEDSVEVMVAIHNFLNEEAWNEVLKWEKRLPGGEHAKLAKFQGKPGELSPKARMHLWAGKLFPDRFNTTPPFDRHDWVVTRPVSSSSPTSTPPAAATETVTTRYVIDYYSAPPDEEGNPVFNLDVRPALDSFESLSQRIKVGVEEWMRGDSE